MLLPAGLLAVAAWRDLSLAHAPRWSAWPYSRRLLTQVRAGSECSAGSAGVGRERASCGGATCHAYQHAGPLCARAAYAGLHGRLPAHIACPVALRSGQSCSPPPRPDSNRACQPRVAPSSRHASVTYQKVPWRRNWLPNVVSGLEEVLGPTSAVSDPPTVARGGARRAQGALRGGGPD